MGRGLCHESALLCTCVGGVVGLRPVVSECCG